MVRSITKESMKQRPWGGMAEPTEEYGKIAIALRDPMGLFLASDHFANRGWLVVPSGCYEPHLLGLDLLFEKLNITHVLSEPDMEEYWRARGLIVISKQAKEQDSAQQSLFMANYVGEGIQDIPGRTPGDYQPINKTTLPGFWLSARPCDSG